MTSNGKRLDPPDLSHYKENRNKLPPEELSKYWGKHVALSPDGMRIVASGDSIAEVDDKLAALGIHFSEVVHAYIDSPDASLI